MKILINGQHMAIGNSLQDYVKERVNHVVCKYFENPISATIHFVKQNFQIDTEILVNEGTRSNIVMKSNSSSDDVYASFDIALAKLEKQLRRYKSKISNHKDRMRTSDAIESMAAVKYVISPFSQEEEDNTDNPAIIAEKPTEIHTLSVSDAVMRMDLQNLPALLFKNAKTNRINVVYYRKDGNISWVDTTNA
jgi:ribosomal subunit interface protein